MVQRSQTYLLPKLLQTKQSVGLYNASQLKGSVTVACHREESRQVTYP